MWDTPFDESMLTAQPGVAIYCPPDDSLAEELFGIFKQNGLGENWTAGVCGNRVYCASKNRLQYGDKHAVEATSPYCNYIKCTFYGIEGSDFDVASDDELKALFGIGGG